jgi:hypothetical protein
LPPVDLEHGIEARSVDWIDSQTIIDNPESSKTPEHLSNGVSLWLKPMKGHDPWKEVLSVN